MNDQTNPSSMDEPEEPELPPLADQKLESPSLTGDQPEKQPLPPMFKLSWQFAAGLLGWFLVNGLIWLLVFGNYFDQLFLLILPLNLGVLIMLSRNHATRQIAGGILTAWGVNLLLSLILGLVYNAVCLIPFFFDNL